MTSKSVNPLQQIVESAELLPVENPQPVSQLMENIISVTPLDQHKKPVKRLCPRCGTCHAPYDEIK